MTRSPTITPPLPRPEATQLVTLITGRPGTITPPPADPDHAPVTTTGAIDSGDTPASRRAAQRRSALARANDVRTALSAIRGEIARGELEVTDALRDPRAQRMAIYDLLRARPRCGPRIARKILAQLQIAERRRVGELTDRQRGVIAERLGALYLVKRASDV